MKTANLYVSSFTLDTGVTLIFENPIIFSGENWTFLWLQEIILTMNIIEIFKLDTIMNTGLYCCPNQKQKLKSLVLLQYFILHCIIRVNLMI